MFRTLAITAGASFVLAAVCIGGAIAIGGPQLMENGHWQMTFDPDEPQESRDLVWAAGHELTFTNAGDVHFRQGPERKIIITGPASVVRRYRMQDGEISLEGGGIFDNAPSVSIEVTAPDVDTFTFNGSWDATLAGLDQQHVTIEINGDGDVEVNGKATDATININGSGDVDAGALASQTAHVDIAGSGDATIAPTQAANIDIAGSGDVTLTTNPPQITSDISGSGEIHRDADAAHPTPTPPATPHAE